MAQPVSIRVAALDLGVTPQAVRGWLRQGAPCVQAATGSGPGRGSLVDVEELRRWRERGAEACLPAIAQALLDTFRRDGGEGIPIHRSLGVSDRAAAALLVTVYHRIHHRLVGCDPVELPPELESVFFQSLHSVGNRSTGNSR
jgi:hypothetical protein